MVPRLTRRKHLDLEDELLSWYEGQYPDNSITWILNILLREFKEAHENHTPREIAKYAGISAMDIAKESST